MNWERELAVLQHPRENWCECATGTLWEPVDREGPSSESRDARMPLDAASYEDGAGVGRLVHFAL